MKFGNFLHLGTTWAGEMTGQKGRSGGGGRNAGLPPGYWEARGGRKAAAAAKKERLAADKQRALSVFAAAVGRWAQPLLVFKTG